MISELPANFDVKIGKVGDEICVIIEYHSPQRSMILGKLCQVFVHVENNGDADNECDGKEICANELADDIPIKFLQQTEWIDSVQPGKVAFHPFCCFDYPMAATVKPSSGLEQLAVLSDLVVSHYILFPN